MQGFILKKTIYFLFIHFYSTRDFLLKVKFSWKLTLFWIKQLVYPTRDLMVRGSKTRCRWTYLSVYCSYPMDEELIYKFTWLSKLSVLYREVVHVKSVIQCSLKYSGYEGCQIRCCTYYISIVQIYELVFPGLSFGNLELRSESVKRRKIY